MPRASKRLTSSLHFSGASRVQVATGLLLWRGPEPLDALPPALPPQPSPSLPLSQLPPEDADASAAASPIAAAAPPQPVATHAARGCGAAANGAAAQDVSEPEAAVPMADKLQPPPAVQQDADGRQEAPGQHEAAKQQFWRDFRRRSRRGGGAAVLSYLAALITGCCALALLSDLALRRFPGHSRGGSLRWEGSRAANWNTAPLDTSTCHSLCRRAPALTAQLGTRAEVMHRASVAQH